ncbi:hypothetical protein Pmani_018534 [Petrolisthes manimaculis]|uniref:PDZ domain-containing protein n=1 Tax=Petrolisthes manimaculis TaxID=1843537 RepID=A0AAE1PK43_9EUCA|nr:hypothetical protein Pmani_018534 [Petrolisthes manimaculis]
MGRKLEQLTRGDHKETIHFPLGSTRARRRQWRPNKEANEVVAEQQPPRQPRRTKVDRVESIRNLFRRSRSWDSAKDLEDLPPTPRPIPDHTQDDESTTKATSGSASRPTNTPGDNLYESLKDMSDTPSGTPVSGLYRSASTSLLPGCEAGVHEPEVEETPGEVEGDSGGGTGCGTVVAVEAEKAARKGQFPYAFLRSRLTSVAEEQQQTGSVVSGARTVVGAGSEECGDSGRGSSTDVRTSYSETDTKSSFSENSDTKSSCSDTSHTRWARDHDEDDDEDETGKEGVVRGVGVRGGACRGSVITRPGPRDVVSPIPAPTGFGDGDFVVTVRVAGDGDPGCSSVYIHPEDTNTPTPTTTTPTTPSPPSDTEKEVPKKVKTRRGSVKVGVGGAGLTDEEKLEAIVVTTTSGSCCRHCGTHQAHPPQAPLRRRPRPQARHHARLSCPAPPSPLYEAIYPDESRRASLDLEADLELERARRRHSRSASLDRTESWRWGEGAVEGGYDRRPPSLSRSALPQPPSAPRSFRLVRLVKGAPGEGLGLYIAGRRSLGYLIAHILPGGLTHRSVITHSVS